MYVEPASLPPKKKLKKTIPVPVRAQSLLGPRHPGSGAVTRHDLAPTSSPPLTDLNFALRRAVAVVYWVGTPTSQAFPSSCFSRRFFFFLEIEIACFFFAVWPVLDSIQPCDWEISIRKTRFHASEERMGYNYFGAIAWRLRSPCLHRDDGTRSRLGSGPRWRSRPP